MRRYQNPIHGQHCCCPDHRPDAYWDRPVVSWRIVALVAVSGTVAMVVDLAGFTPTIAAWLGMMP